MRAGLGVAGFQIGLEKSGRLECPQGLFRLGTVPQQRLAAFLALTVIFIGCVGFATLMRKPAAMGGGGGGH